MFANQINECTAENMFTGFGKNCREVLDINFWDSPLRKEVKVKGNSGLLFVYYPFIPFVN